MAQLNLYRHWRGLTPDQRSAFAKIAKTSVNYIENHLIHRRKTPQAPLIARLVTACKRTGMQDAAEADLLVWFFKGASSKKKAKPVRG